MPFTLEQALFHRPDEQHPQLLASSAGFDGAWRAEAERLMLGFGERRVGWRCPLAIFARPLTAKHVAIVRVRDHGEPAPTALRFHFFVLETSSYENYVRDPFMLAAKIEPVWDAPASLSSLSLPTDTFSPRTLPQVREVLKRVKAGALQEGEDPEAPDFARTIDNSESPALLGGTQVLVDGGRLVFERPQGDLRLVSGLWLLLPEMTRCRRWPTSFAFSEELDFDVLVVPRLNAAILDNYTTEEQASDYPDGTYEMALQHAVESGTQDDLDAVFSKRDSSQTIRLALVLLVLISGLVLVSRWLETEPVAPRPAPLTVQQAEKFAAVAGMVGTGDPWTAVGIYTLADTLWRTKK